MATVSRALRTPERHNKATSARILQVATSLGYDPLNHQGARRLALSRFDKHLINHLIAVAFPPYFYRANYFAEIYQGLLDVLTPEGFGLLTLNTLAEYPRKLPPSFSRGDVDGVIILGDIHTIGKMTALLHEEPCFAQRPILTLLDPFPGSSMVGIDAQQAGQLAAAHLLDLGHRHLLHFFGPGPGVDWSPREWSYLMLLGYQSACRERGLRPVEHLHYLKMDTRLRALAFQAVNHPRLQALDAVGLPLRHPVLRMLQARPFITAILRQTIRAPCSLVICCGRQPCVSRRISASSGVMIPTRCSTSRVGIC